jgi:hypothetical protein
MNAMEKVAWTELSVSLGVSAFVLLLAPWLGSAASAGFALMALIALSALFLREKGRVVVDERDRWIERTAQRFAFSAAWMTLFFSLILLVVWSSTSGAHVVSTRLLNWLVWSQFPILYGVKGLTAVVLYRSSPDAA